MTFPDSLPKVCPGCRLPCADELVNGWYGWECGSYWKADDDGDSGAFQQGASCAVLSKRSEHVNAVKTHELKTWPDFFEAVLSGEKTFELRYDDRGFHVGDILTLCEWLPVDQHYTGRVLHKEVTYVLSGLGLALGWVCMGIKEAP